MSKQHAIQRTSTYGDYITRLYTSERFDVQVYNHWLPDVYVSIIAHRMASTLPKTPYGLGSHVCSIKGELGRMFLNEWEDLQLPEVSNVGKQEYRWRLAKAEPFITKWIERMQAVELACKVLDVQRD